MALVLHYRADTLGLANAANVTTIPDLVGSATASPIEGDSGSYVTPGQNGLGIVRVQASDGFMATPPVRAQPFTLIFAIKLGNAALSGTLMNIGGVLIYCTGTDMDMNAGADYVLPVQDAAFHVYTAYFSGTSSVWRRDGTTLGTTGNAGTNGIAAANNAILAGQSHGFDFGELQIHSGDARGGADETAVIARWLQAASQTAVLPLVTSSQTLFNPTVTARAVLPLVTSAQTLFGPTVTRGPVTTVLPLVTSAQTVHSPSVSLRRMQLPLVTNTPTVFSANVVISTGSFIEPFTGTNNDPWGPQWVTGTNGTGTIADIQTDKGRMVTGTSTFGKVGARNTAKFLSSSATYTVDMTVPTYTEWWYYVHIRGSSGVSNTFKLASSYQIRYACNGSVVSPELWQVDASGNETFRVSMGMSGSPVAGDTIRSKIRVSGTSSITLEHKSWKVGTAEPGFYTDVSANVSVAYTGQYFMLSVQGGNNTTSEQFLWEDFSATATALTAVLPLINGAPTVFSPPVKVTIAAPMVYNTTSGVLFDENGDPIFDEFGSPIRVENLDTFMPAVQPKQYPVLPRVQNPFTVFTPAVLGQQTVVVPLLVNISNAFNPTVSYTKTAVLPLVTNAPTVFSPGLAIAAQTIVAPIVYMTTSDIILDENGLPILDENGLPLRDSNAGVFAPTVILQAVFVPLVTSPQTVFSPSIVSTSQTVVLPFVTSTQTLFAPTTQSLVATPLVTSAQTVFNPTISGGAQTATLPLVTNAATVFAPTAQYTQSPVLPLVTNTQTVFSPATLPAQTTVLPLVTNTLTVFEPTITLGGLAVAMVRVMNTPTVFSPTVNPLLSTITMVLVDNEPTVFALAVNPGLYLFLPPHDEGGPRKLSEQGRRRQGVSKMANDFVGRYGAPRSFSVLKIGGAYVMIQGPTVRQTLDAEEYYAGGHEYEVDYETAQALEAAGFDVQGFG